MKLPHRRQFLYLTSGAVALSAASCIARAQAYPARPIRLVIPFPPGGAYDAVGRPWADRVKSVLGTVVVENIGGGGSSLGAAAVARARPDGYTILLGGTQTHVNEALLKSRRSTTQSRTWIRLRAWPPMFSVSPSIRQCQCGRSRS